MKILKTILAMFAVVSGLHAAIPTLSDFNTTQFDTNGNKISIKSGASTTNLGYLPLTGGTETGNVVFSNANPQVIFYDTSGTPNARKFVLFNSFGQFRFELRTDNDSSITLLGRFDKFGNWTMPAALTVVGVTNSGGFYNSDGTPYVFGGSAGTTNIYETIQVQTNTFNVGKGGKVTITNNFTIVTNGIVTLSNLPPSVLVLGSDNNVTNAILVGLTLSGNTLTAIGLATKDATATNLTIAGGSVTTTNLTWNTETLSPSGTTNFVVDLLSPRTALITATADVNFLNSTNRTASTATERSKKVRILASGANRLVTLHANWLLVGSTTRTFTVTNGTWLAMAFDNAGPNETNVFVGATYAQ